MFASVENRHHLEMLRKYGKSGYHVEYTALRKDVEGFIQMAFFDPGIKNTGFRIERRTDTSTWTVDMGIADFSKNAPMDILSFVKEHSRDLMDCHYILVESQLSKNRLAVEISKHIISTIICLINSGACIIEIDSKYKTDMIVGSKKRTKSDNLKAMSVVRANEILLKNKDEKGLLMLNELRKKDDVSDCVCYLEAWYEGLEFK